MRRYIAAGLCALALLAVPARAQATGCEGLARACVRLGGTPAACERARLSCNRTCQFVGPVTGHIYPANGTGHCKNGVWTAK